MGKDDKNEHKHIRINDYNPFLHLMLHEVREERSVQSKKKNR